MKETGFPVCYDATHSIQLPTSHGDVSGGQKEFIPAMVRAAMSYGANSLFLEVHDNPAKALSDAGSQIPLEALKMVLSQAVASNKLYIEMKAKWPENEYVKSLNKKVHRLSRT